MKQSLQNIVLGTPSARALCPSPQHECCLGTGRPSWGSDTPSPGVPVVLRGTVPAPAANTTTKGSTPMPGPRDAWLGCLLGPNPSLLSLSVMTECAAGESHLHTAENKIKGFIVQALGSVFFFLTSKEENISYPEKWTWKVQFYSFQEAKPSTKDKSIFFSRKAITVLSVSGALVTSDTPVWLPTEWAKLGAHSTGAAWGCRPQDAPGEHSALAWEN